MLGVFQQKQREGRGVRKTENLIGFGFLNANHPKIWHPLRRFSGRSCVQFKLKVTKNSFICIQCAVKELSKPLLKQSLDM